MTPSIEFSVYLTSTEGLVYLMACIGGICSSIVSIAILLGDTSMWRSSIPNSSRLPPSLPTRRVSTYINLNSVNYTGGQAFPPISSYAQVVLQTDLESPNRPMSEVTRSYSSHEGVVYPDDRHILATAIVRTILLTYFSH